MNKPGKKDGLSPIPFLDILENCEKQFEMVRILDEEGKVVQQDLVPDLSEKDLLELMKRMVFARVFDDQTNSYSQQARMGFYAPSRGQEAAQIASHFAFAKEDWLYGGYRDIPQVLMHGASVSDVYLWSKGHVQGSQYTFEKDIKATIPQIIIGAQMVQAQGNAYGQKLNNSKNVTFAYTGDGGTSEGDTYEAMNFAGVYKSPLIFFFQNNGYAISTPIDIQTNARTLAQKAIAAGIPGVQVDGNDALATYVVSKQAREYAAAGNGPVVIELITNRMLPHSTMGDDHLRYRDQASLDEWERRDPLLRLSNYLREKGIYNDDLEQDFRDQALETIKAGMEEAEAVGAMSLSESFNWQYETMPQTLKEQQALLLEKEGR